MPPETVTREVLGNIGFASKCVFYALATASLLSFGYGVRRRVRLWKRGRASGQTWEWRRAAARVLRHVLLQDRVRRGRRDAGLAHLLMFGGFGVLFIGTVLIAIEHYGAALLGREATDPLFHKGLYFVVYEVVLDTAGLAFLAGCCWFAQRRFRGRSSIGQGAFDGAVLALLVLLGITGYATEALRILYEQNALPGFSYVGYILATVLGTMGVTADSATTMHWFVWWIHTVLSFTFIATIPYTRLLHAVAGTVNLATTERQLGTMAPVSIEEVEETGIVGATQITDFTTAQLVELDACVSCGRCQDVCPAFEAGKPLSPRNVVQDLKSQFDQLGPDAEDEDQPESPPMMDVIGEETIFSCTSCHACVDTCPLGVDPLRFLTDLRRNFVGEGQLRGTPATSLQNMQRSGNPWGLPANERASWHEGLNVPLVADNPDFEVLYWVGCAAAYDRRIQKVARAVVQLLHAANVNFAVLGPEERCTGESARRMGDEFLFQELAATNIEVLDQHKVRKIVTHCPHCLNSLKHDYSQFGGSYEVVHHTQFLADLVADERLVVPSKHDHLKRAYHDPCYLARVNGITESPRTLVQLRTDNMVELPRCGRDTACCGAGGGRMWFDDDAKSRVGQSRIEELAASGADEVIVSCPFCLTMVNDGLAARGEGTETKDIAELLSEALDD